jgi:hypothetical protein
LSVTLYLTSTSSPTLAVSGVWISITGFSVSNVVTVNTILAVPVLPCSSFALTLIVYVPSWATNLLSVKVTLVVTPFLT